MFEVRLRGGPASRKTRHDLEGMATVHGDCPDFHGGDDVALEKEPHRHENGTVPFGPIHDTPMSNGKHILVVEDEKHLATGIKYNLEAEGYRVTAMGDGPSALRFIQQNRNDVDLWWC